MRRAFSLLELMAVVSLTGLLLGVSLVNMQSASDQSCLRAAADQISTAYRLALMEAARTGRPHALALSGTTCSIRRPVQVDGNWMWGSGAVFDLPPKVQIEGPEGSASSNPEHLLIPVSPDWSDRFQVRLVMPSGLQAGFEIGGHGEVRLLKDVD